MPAWSPSSPGFQQLARTFVIPALHSAQAAPVTPLDYELENMLPREPASPFPWSPTPPYLDDDMLICCDFYCCCEFFIVGVDALCFLSTQRKSLFSVDSVVSTQFTGPW